MPELRPIAKLYIAILALAALGALLAGALTMRGVSNDRILIATAMGILLALAAAFPLHFADKTKITLDMSLIFAATLLFEPGLAMLVAAGGLLVAQAVRRDPWIQNLFNSSQSVLQAGAAGLILSLAGWSYADPAFGRAGLILAIAGAALAVYLINVLAVAGIVSLQAGAPFREVVRESFGFGMLQDLALFSLGLFGVIVIDEQSSMLPIFLLPAVVTYLSLVWHIRARDQGLTLLPASRLDRSSKLYLGAVTLAALGLIPVMAGGLRDLSGQDALLAIAVGACMTLAYLYPLRLGFKLELLMDGGVLFAAVLLFEPAVAMLVAGGGTVLAHLIRRRRRAQTVFNSVQTMLQAAVGGLLLALVNWNPGDVTFGADQIIMLGVAGVAMYLVNTLSVSAMIGLHQRMAPLAIWRRHATRRDMGIRVAEYGVGVLAAFVLATYSWSLPLVAVPAVLLYRLLRTRRALDPEPVQAEAPATAG